MDRFVQIAKRLLPALLSTALAFAAFAGLARAGAGTETSLFAAMILAGLLNIGATASLNAEPFLPTSGAPVGDC
ncbi:MAG: hypothetical protein WDN08_00885 [Rhizomicrobium sp.]